MIVSKATDARHMTFSILTTLMNNFVRQIESESRVYSAEYPVYRDPAFSFDVLRINIDRVQEFSKQSEQLLYSDLLLLGNAIKEHLGMIDDECCDLEVWKRGKTDDYLVGKGYLGFTKAAILVSEEQPVISDIRS